MKINEKEKPVEPATSPSIGDSVGNKQDSSESIDVQKSTEDKICHYNRGFSCQDK